MVDTVSSSSGTAAAMTTAMAKLQDDINKLRQQFQSGTPAKSSDEVESFRKDIRKSPFNTVASATDIGVLVKDTSRLNAISALTKSDPVDFYKFRAANDGQATLGALGDDTVRIQLLSQGGAVIADNDDKESDRIARENYDKLKEGSFDLEKGVYVVRVSRKSGSDPQAVQNYAVQLTMGDFTKDYDTVAKAALATDRYGPTTPQSTQNLFDMLNSSVSTLQSLGPIGQSATDKLLGTLYSGSF